MRTLGSAIIFLSMSVCCWSQVNIAGYASKYKGLLHASFANIRIEGNARVGKPIIFDASIMMGFVPGDDSPRNKVGILVIANGKVESSKILSGISGGDTYFLEGASGPLVKSPGQKTLVMFSEDTYSSVQFSALEE